MDYAPAKELKDAGFPQHEMQHGALYVFPNGRRIESESATSPSFAGCYIPTLEELIEACGIGFIALHHEQNNWKASHDDADDDRVWYDTPIEAVARLWLALNKKV